MDFSPLRFQAEGRPLPPHNIKMSVGDHDMPLLLKGVHSGQCGRVEMGAGVPDPGVEGRQRVRRPSGWQPAELWVPQAAASVYPY